jgi:hypothetical protein
MIVSADISLNCVGFLTRTSVAMTLSRTYSLLLSCFSFSIVISSLPELAVIFVFSSFLNRYLNCSNHFLVINRNFNIVFIQFLTCGLKHSALPLNLGSFVHHFPLGNFLALENPHLLIELISNDTQSLQNSKCSLSLLWRAFASAEVHTLVYLL